MPFLSEPGVNDSERNIDVRLGAGTPHALALSYIAYPNVAVAALKALKANYPKIETPFGWYDAVDKHGRTGQKIQSLDQGMFVAAFLAKEINKDVQRYLERKNYLSDVRTMYGNFATDAKLTYGGIGGTKDLTTELSGYEQQPLWRGVPIPVK